MFISNSKWQQKTILQKIKGPQRQNVSVWGFSSYTEKTNILILCNCTQWPFC